MKIRIILLAAVAACTTHAFASEPVNSSCPVSGRDVSSDYTVTLGEDTVAFCCGGCVKGFQKWDEAKQLTYIAEQKATSTEKPTIETESKYVVNTPYLLDICPISGQKLDSKGDTVVEVIDGREVRFCCAECPEKFKEDKTKMFAKLDKLMIANQLPFYPLTTCILSGEELDLFGEPVDFIYGNRLFRTCCDNCKGAFLKDPEDLIQEVDEAIVKAQLENYPLSTCVIGKGPLDGMGGPEHMIVGNRLVEICCNGCRKGVLKDPLAVFAKIDASLK